MSSGIFYRWVSINIWQEPKTKSIVIIVGRVGESVHNDAMILRMVNLQHAQFVFTLNCQRYPSPHLADPAVELVVGDAAPVLGLLVSHRLHTGVTDLADLTRADRPWPRAAADLTQAWADHGPGVHLRV